MATWHTIESARDEWPDAPSDYGDDGDNTLLTLLAVAKEAVIAYAPAGTAGTVLQQDEDGYIVEVEGAIPDGYRAAQLKAARNSWTTSKVSSEGFADGGQFGLESTFLPWHQDVRPKTGKPWIG